MLLKCKVYVVKKYLKKDELWFLKLCYDCNYEHIRILLESHAHKSSYLNEPTIAGIYRKLDWPIIYTIQV